MASDSAITDEEVDEPLDVLDLPQLYRRPSTATLLNTLDDLTYTQPSWVPSSRSGDANAAPRTSSKRRKVRQDGIPNYLTQIISSSLSWIESDVEKERIWEAAAIRLSERSGRSGMGNLIRSFPIPLTEDPVSTEDGVASSARITPDRFDSDDVLEIILHEPALTADNLGLKTWSSAYLLARRLLVLQKSLPRLPEGMRILELGSGTGLVGLVAAVVFHTRVLLTDLPAIVPNLECNLRANASVLSEHGGTAEAVVLDWSDPSTVKTTPPLPANSFPLILVADALYSPEHPRILVDAIAQHLSKDSDARVVIELPLREAYLADRNDLKERMIGIGLGLVEEGEEAGYDDWVAHSTWRNLEEEELTEVRCWWGVWGWRRE